MFSGLAVQRGIRIIRLIKGAIFLFPIVLGLVKPWLWPILQLDEI